MFNRAAKKKEAAELQLTISRLIEEMDTYGPNTPEYTEAFEHLEKIYALKTTSSPKQIDPNTMLLVGGNLMGILIIVIYESRGALVSKATSFINKPAIK